MQHGKHFVGRIAFRSIGAVVRCRQLVAVKAADANVAGVATANRKLHTDI